MPVFPSILIGLYKSAYKFLRNVPFSFGHSYAIFYRTCRWTSLRLRIWKKYGGVRSRWMTCNTHIFSTAAHVLIVSAVHCIIQDKTLPSNKTFTLQWIEHQSTLVKYFDSIALKDIPSNFCDIWRVPEVITSSDHSYLDIFTDASGKIEGKL